MLLSGVMLWAALFSLTHWAAQAALHPFWSVASADSANQLLHFLEGIGIIGGVLVVAAFGPGRISIDARAGRP